MHFCTRPPATAAKTYYEDTLDRNAASGTSYTKNATTNLPIM
jgi:hypothetical protein